MLRLIFNWIQDIWGNIYGTRDRSDEKGYRVEKSLIFAIGINGIKDI